MSNKYKMNKFIVDAVQFDGTIESIEQVTALAKNGENIMTRNCGSILSIKTMNGMVNVLIGDWVIKYNDCDLMMCKKNTFKNIYERLD